MLICRRALNNGILEVEGAQEEEGRERESLAVYTFYFVWVDDERNLWEFVKVNEVHLILKWC